MDHDNNERSAHSRFGDLLIGDGQPVRIMGVINVSPESFFKGSVLNSEDALRRTAERMDHEGADIIDIGARGSAPYLETDISAEEEAERMYRAILAVREVTDKPISADTRLAMVATEARKAGASILNDISGLAHDTMMPEAAKTFDGAILMAHADYTNVPGEPVTVVKQALRAALQRAQQAGVPMDKIVLDPGIGFFRNRDIPWDEWDRRILRSLAAFRDFGIPLIIGLSRKSFIGKALGYQDAGDRLYGSLGLTSLAVYGGAHVVRTHDVAATRDVVRIAQWFAGASGY